MFDQRFCKLVRLALAAMTFWAAAEVRAQAKVGTYSAPFLGIAVGARAVAMGGTFAAVASDASALYWNPGGISRLDNSQTLISHTKWLVDTDFNWAGVVLKVGGNNAIGFSVTQL
ncbi:MAG: hypothetical protein ONA90_07710, partial [candidate division KSB1 bacterium]|nr:hypothetical protein [candidate division KSB1 bacterium]